jgi:hypothetical protein
VAVRRRRGRRGGGLEVEPEIVYPALYGQDKWEDWEDWEDSTGRAGGHHLFVVSVEVFVAGLLWLWLLLALACSPLRPPTAGAPSHRISF